MTFSERLAARAARLFGKHLSLRFILIGAVNTAVGYSLLVLLLLAGLSVELAALFALILGILFSYYTQGTIVFRYRSRGAFLRFVLLWALIYFVNLAIIRSLMSLGLSAYAAGAFAVAPITLLSFFMQKLAVFRPKQPDRELE